MLQSDFSRYYAEKRLWWSPFLIKMMAYTLDLQLNRKETSVKEVFP